jgi:hypothetical protein
MGTDIRLKYGRYGGSWWLLLSVPNACRSTPIRITVLRFIARVDPEGKMSVRIVA